MIATKNLKTCLESPWIGLKDGLKFDFKNLAIFGQIWSNFRVIFLLDAFHGGKKFKAKSARGRSELSKYTPKSFPIWSFSRFWSDFWSGVEGKIWPKIAHKNLSNWRVAFSRKKFRKFSFTSLNLPRKKLAKTQRVNFTRFLAIFWPIFGKILPSTPDRKSLRNRLKLQMGKLLGVYLESSDLPLVLLALNFFPHGRHLWEKWP